MIRVLGRKEEQQVLHRLEKRTGKEVHVAEKILMEGSELFFAEKGVAAFVEHFGKQLRIEQAGLFIGDEKKTFFSIEGAQVLASFFAKKKELSMEEVGQWMHGSDIPCAEDGLFLLACREDVVGAAIAKDGKISNTVPKERRIKNSKTLISGF